MARMAFHYFQDNDKALTVLINGSDVTVEVAGMPDIKPRRVGEMDGVRMATALLTLLAFQLEGREVSLMWSTGSLRA